jgi:hypothetical protein
MKNLRLITFMTAVAAVFSLSWLMLNQVEASVPNNSVTSIKVVDESLTGAEVV